MRRTELKRRTPLRARKASLRVRVVGVDQSAARETWKDPKAGPCQCGCDRFSMHLERHHIVPRSWLRQNHRLDVEWDLRNSLLLHPLCHARHTNAFRKLPIESVPSPALTFAVEVMGDELAAAMLSRWYRADVSWKPAA